MEAQQFWQLSFMSIWIFVCFFPSVCSRADMPIIELKHRVFVALAGDQLDIDCELMVPANKSVILTCSDPLDTQIYSCDIPAVAFQPRRMMLTLELKNLTSSGEYYCQYETAKVYWFLRVRNDGYRELERLDYTEFIIVAVVTGVLLVFSVVGSVYVFRGHWKESVTECGNIGKRKQTSREERKERETVEAGVNVVTSSSTSFYASLEPRPRSIYDVLDHSAVNREPDQSKTKAKAKNKEAQKTTSQTAEHEDVFESVYENF
ncbi:NFAT activation molecule 1 [Pempheris klunzingeri]|uniref:NFAT activation molecule 1 n=1 Tax=Pempheris klunzingeri TaxID=3127111 RepID=UPI00397F832C